jgi:hypothetical protein
MDNELSEKIKEWKHLESLEGKEALRTYQYRVELRRTLVPLLIAEIERLTALIDPDVDTPEWDFQECMRQYDHQQERACQAEDQLAALQADLTDAILSRDHFGTLWDDLREDLDDKRAGRPLLAKATDRINDLENELAALKKANEATCTWTEDIDSIWTTSCGQSWFFDTDDPEANSAYFCHHCGKKLVTVHYEPESEEE